MSGACGWRGPPAVNPSVEEMASAAAGTWDRLSWIPWVARGRQQPRSAAAVLRSASGREREFTMLDFRRVVVVAQPGLGISAPLRPYRTVPVRALPTRAPPAASPTPHDVHDHRRPLRTPRRRRARHTDHRTLRSAASSPRRPARSAHSRAMGARAPTPHLRHSASLMLGA